VAAPYIIAAVGFGSSGKVYFKFKLQSTSINYLAFCCVLGVVGGSIAAGVQSGIGNVALGEVKCHNL